MSKKIANFEDFKNYRQELEQSQKNETEVRVAMATCAIATGSKNVYDVMSDAIAQQGLKNVRLKETGCMGYCYAEPTVEIVRPGEEPVMYGHVDNELAQRIVLEDLLQGERTDGVLEARHENA